MMRKPELRIWSESIVLYSTRIFDANLSQSQDALTRLELEIVTEVCIYSVDSISTVSGCHRRHYNVDHGLLFSFTSRMPICISNYFAPLYRRPHKPLNWLPTCLCDWCTKPYLLFPVGFYGQSRHFAVELPWTGFVNSYKSVCGHKGIAWGQTNLVIAFNAQKWLLCTDVVSVCYIHLTPIGGIRFEIYCLLVALL